MDILVVHAYLQLSMDINRYAWTTLLSMDMQWIVMDIHSLSMDIHLISMDIRVQVGYPRKSMDIQNIQHSHAILELKETSSNNQTLWDSRPLWVLTMSEIFRQHHMIQATSALEHCDIFWAISQLSHPIPFIHRALVLIVGGDFSRRYWGLMSCVWAFSHLIHRARK